MSANLTGNVYGERQASVHVIHTYVVNFNSTGVSSAILLDTIRATTDKPVQIECSAQVVTAFNAVSTNVLTLGSTTTATEYLASGDITEGTPGYYPASNAVTKFRLTSDTPLYVKYTQSGTAATTGQAVMIVKEFSENTRAIV